MAKAGATISVICATRHPGSVVGAAMAELRDVVDEILIAADSRVGEEDLAEYAAVADRVLPFEFSGMNRSYAWLAAAARGDWLLLVDGDEVAGSGLIDALPEMVADRRIGQYLLPKRWSWPAASSYLVDEPWGDDRDSRLFRNDGRTLLPGRPHLAIAIQPPFRFVEDAPIYHLDLLLNDEPTRRAKAERYDMLRSGLLTASGRPFNRAYYLPEERPEPATAPTGESDRLRIDRVLAGDGPVPREIRREPMRTFTAAEVESHWPGRSVAPEAYRAEIGFAGDLPRFASGARGHQLWVRVRNTGSERWPGGSEHPPLIRLGARWRRGGRELPGSDRAFLPHPLEPGEETLVPLAVTGPEPAGPAELAVDLVHEHVRWFDSPATAIVEVEPSAVDQLAELERRHGPPVPLGAVMDLRARLGRADALVTSPDPVGAGTFADLIASGRPSYVAEIGSGTRTVTLARMLGDLHGDDEIRVLSFDQDPASAEATRAALAEHGLLGFAEVLVLPLRESAGMPRGYELTDEARVMLRAHPPDLVLVDGLSIDSGASRLGALDLIEPYAAPGAALLLDDALRDAELRVALAWAERPDLEVLGIRVAGRGLLEARLSRATPA